jgi:nucleotide-binding universal stress UspA family protein
MRDLLIHVRDFGRQTAAARYGLRLAAEHHASATGAYVYPAPVEYAPMHSPDLLQAMVNDARSLEEDALRAGNGFVEWAATVGVPHAHWLVAEGDSGYALAQAATRHDLVILEHETSADGEVGDLADIVLKVQAPCIVVPKHGWDYGPIERVAVAWNGSPEAMRALRAALPLMRDKNVLLMSGELRNIERNVRWKTPFDVGAYLQRHGIGVLQSPIMAPATDAGGAILEESMHFHADLLVMGAYGRSRFSEWLLGGATRYALSWAEMPLLVQH